MATFSHLDPGTAESVWASATLDRPVTPLDVGDDDLIVVAAHPDDETLGAAGLIRRVSDRGGGVTVVVATDGEASHPDSPSHTPLEIATRRRAEVARAVALLSPTAEVQFLGIPDGSLRENHEALATGLIAAIDHHSERAAARRGLLVAAPWTGDGHRDHRIAGEVAQRICSERTLPLLWFPIWMWHWGGPDDLPWEVSRVLTLTPEEREAKRLAVLEHSSQVEPLSPASGDEAVISPSLRAYAERGYEWFIPRIEPNGRAGASMNAEWFAAFYARHDDPWGFESRWYEQRKRAILVASLPAKQLGRVLELGCATGIVTRELVARAEQVVAVDPVEAALTAARSRVGDDSRVQFRRGQVPADWPEGEFDTIVMSEVGYYLSKDDLARTIQRIDGSLADDGSLVACHWRHPVPGYPQTGDSVHAALRRSGCWRAIVRHDEPDFVLEVFCRPPAHSVAQREGLV